MVIPQLTTGGAEHSFSKVALALSKHHKLTVVVFNDAQIHFQLPCEVLSLEISGGKSPVHKILRFYQRLQKLKKIAKAREIDVIISYLEGANYINILMPDRYKKIISQRGSVFNDETMRGIMRWIRIHVLIRLLYKGADRIVALNEELKQELIRLSIPGDIISVIPNMFMISEIVNKSVELTETSFTNDRRTKLCVVGRLAPEKGFHHLMPILKKVKSSSVNKVVLYLIGEGGEQQYLEESARQNGLKIGYHLDLDYSNYDIIFLGRKSNPFKYLNHADMLLITSSSEGGPNILIESMICETMVASVNCPSGPRIHISPSKNVNYDLKKIFIGENGLLLPHFQNKNLEEVYSVWSEFLASPIDKELKYTLISNAKKYADKFSNEKIVKEWLRQIEMCYL